MVKEPYACLTRKNGKYYVVIYYYTDGKRKSKSRPTGISVDAPSQRKVKQQEREALAIKDQVLQEFLFADDPAEELFTATARAWLERQEGQKAQSTLASYANIVRDICIYFERIKPTKTVDMTSVDVEDYLAWERRRRRIYRTVCSTPDATRRFRHRKYRQAPGNGGTKHFAGCETSRHD